MDPDQHHDTPEPHGESHAESPTTERGFRRWEEDERFVPVIIKRTDEARRHPDDVLSIAIEKGAEQLTRTPVSLLLSALTAGLILGFTPMGVAITYEIAEGLQIPLAGRLAAAFVYPLGFVFCIMSGAELFTEHTAMAVYPVLDRRVGVRRLLRLWGLVLAGNLIGALLTASLLSIVGDIIANEASIIEVGRKAMAPDALPMLVSAVLAGWLMALGSWLVLTTPPTMAQIVCIYMVTFTIGLGGLHHSIAGAAEVFASLLISDDQGLARTLWFIVLTSVGNLTGGTVFVALLNYAHIRASQTVKGSGA